MKILHLISSRGLFGAERVALELCKNLKHHNCNSIIGVLQNSLNPHLEIVDEASKYSIDSVIFSCRGRLDLKLIFRIRAFVKKNNIDIIHCHGYKSNFYGLLGGRTRTAVITTNHNWLTWHWKLRAYRRLDSLLIRYFDHIVAVSDGIKREMQQYAIPESRISVIDNGIDVSRFTSIESSRIKEEFGIGEGTTIVGTIGNLGEEKGQKYLLRSVKNIKDKFKTLKLLIVGDGPLKEDLKQETQQLGISNDVIFTGYRTDIPQLLSVMDIFVLPSLTEGLPMVLLEAMASRKPIIATNVGAIPKVINKDNGLLVEPKDVTALQRAIEILLNDKGIKQKFASSSYETVMVKFSSEQMCSKYYELYKEVMA